MTLILLVLVIVFLCGGGYGRWGGNDAFAPYGNWSGGLGLVLLIVVMLLLLRAPL